MKFLRQCPKEYHLIDRGTGKKLNHGLPIEDIDIAIALKRQIEARQQAPLILREVRATDFE